MVSTRQSGARRSSAPGAAFAAFAVFANRAIATPAAASPDLAGPPPGTASPSAGSPPAGSPAASSQAPPLSPPGSTAPRATAPPDPVGPGGTAPTAWPAEPEPVRWHARSASFLYRLSFEFGGDDAVRIKNSAGTTDAIKAGGLLEVAAGVLVRPSDAWAIEVTTGYKVDWLTYTTGSAQFARVPVEAIMSFRQAGLDEGGFRAGLGGTVHLNPIIRCTVPGACDSEVRLDNAFGAIAEIVYGFRVYRHVGFDVGLRATLITYSGPPLTNLKDSPDHLDGSCAGLFVGGWL